MPDSTPTPAEIEAATTAAAAFLKAIEEVPESDRIPVTTDKFEAPIGRPEQPAPHRDETRARTD